MLARLHLYQKILQSIYIYTHFIFFPRELAVKHVNKNREHIDKLHCKEREI